jgi:hypothetical protein
MVGCVEAWVQFGSQGAPPMPMSFAGVVGDEVGCTDRACPLVLAQSGKKPDATAGSTKFHRATNESLLLDIAKPSV